jgi:hypothetical protein
LIRRFSASNPGSRSGLDRGNEALETRSEALYLDPEDQPPARRLMWWRELAVIVVFYGLYTAVRDLHQSHPDAVADARANALRIVHAEQWLHIFAEQRIQADFIDDRRLISLLDDFYGTVHFAAVVIVLIVLFRRQPERYALWRNTLALTTGLALIGFWLFPVMPPRLLPASFHFVDTVQTIGGVWNFKSAPVASVSNQFAAMPSLHTAWSIWSALAIMPLIRPVWGKIALVGYPALTIFCIVVTGNHYFADAAGGLVTLGVSYLLARLLTGRAGQWHLHRMLHRNLMPG